MCIGWGHSSRGATCVATSCLATGHTAAAALPSHIHLLRLRPVHCSFLGTVGREMEDNWEEKGQGAVFYLQQEMSDSISGEGRVMGARCQL